MTTPGAFTIRKPLPAEPARMADLIPFPLSSRAALVHAIVDQLDTVHGSAANAFWRERIACIVAGLRAAGLADAAIRQEILALQDAVQAELQDRSRALVDGAA